MTPIAKMVREMIAKGVDPDVIELAVSTAEDILIERASADVRVTSADETAMRRREKDRIRQKNRRDNLRTSADSADNPQMSQNASISLEERIESNSSKKEEAPRRNVRGCRMLPDWKPDPDEWTATVELIGGHRAQAELLKFRDYWIALPGAKGLKADWPATWRNWIRRITENPGVTNGQRPQHANGKPAGNSFFDGLRSLAADIAGDDQPSRPADEEIPRGRFNIDG